MQGALPTTDDAEVILVVDDAQENIDLLVAVLGDQYRVRAALSGEHALEAVARQRPDIVLLDVSMPGLDGYEVCRRLTETADVPVVFITARDDVSDKVRGLEAGAVDYLIRPFEPAEVRARVRLHLELRRARETVRKHSEEVEQLLEQRTRQLVRTARQAAFGQLVQGIVHNARGPLAAIAMAVEELGVVYEGQECDEGTRHSVESLLRVAAAGAHRISKMLDSLLAKSRRDRSHQQEIVDINELVREELEFLKADQRFKHHTDRQIVLCDESLLVRAVPSDLAQVLQNLVNNALDAMENAPIRRLSVTTRATPSAALIAVADTGVGIPPSVLDLVFDPFFTTKPEGRATGPQGTGLGLWMCQEVVKGLGGEIEVESTPGQGATFRFHVPRLTRDAVSGS